MIPVSVPLIFPKVVPVNWDEWFNVWEKHKKVVPKIKTNHNTKQSYWLGFDIYVKDGIDTDELTPYHCENVNCPELFPSLFDNIDKLPLDIYYVRILQSFSRVDPHHDSLRTECHAHSLRTLLIDTNIKPNWYYILPNKEKVYLQLPEETNTWYYNDTVIKHGTDFTPGKYKQLIVYGGKIKEQKLFEMLNDGIARYKNLSILV